MRVVEIKIMEILFKNTHCHLVIMRDITSKAEDPSPEKYTSVKLTNLRSKSL